MKSVSIALQTDGKILVGGRFRQHWRADAQPFRAIEQRHRCAAKSDRDANRWSAGPAAARARNSHALPSSISTDNVNYTPLGEGTAAGQQLDPDRLELADRTELLRPRPRVLSDRQSERLGEHHGIGAECLSPAAPLQLTTAVSHKTHGSAGDFAIPLPLAGEPGVECRSSGGAHTLVFTFNNNVVSGNASRDDRNRQHFGKSRLRRQHHDRESNRRRRRAENHRNLERRDRQLRSGSAETRP